MVGQGALQETRGIIEVGSPAQCLGAQQQGPREGHRGPPGSTGPRRPAEPERLAEDLHGAIDVLMAGIAIKLGHELLAEQHQGFGQQVGHGAASEVSRLIGQGQRTVQVFGVPRDFVAPPEDPRRHQGGYGPPVGRQIAVAGIGPGGTDRLDGLIERLDLAVIVVITRLRGTGYRKVIEQPSECFGCLLPACVVQLPGR